MLIDWFTVCAQIINFIILVWLLKRFLYKPVLKLITDRQEEVAKLLNEAEIKKNEAEEEQRTYRNKNKEFDQQKAERVEQLNAEIKQQHDQLTLEAKQDVEAQRKKWFSNLEKEKDVVYRELCQRVQVELFSIMRKALADLADMDMQERLIDVFLERLKALSDTETNRLLNALQASGRLQFRTASEAPEQLRTKIKAAIQQVFDRPFDIDFVVIPELISGVELVANGQKISWNIADYLSSLELLLNEEVYKKTEIIHA